MTISDCQIDTDCDYEFETISCTIPTARKDHRCGECGRTIKPGEEYEIYKGKYEGKIYTEKTCLDCVSLRNAFFQGSYVYGEVRETIVDQICELQGQVDSKCILPLTDKAREFVFEQIEGEWNNE